MYLFSNKQAALFTVDSYPGYAANFIQKQNLKDFHPGFVLQLSWKRKEGNLAWAQGIGHSDATGSFVCLPGYKSIITAYLQLG